MRLVILSKAKDLRTNPVACHEDDDASPSPLRSSAEQLIQL
jgi:hypothetical protein